MLVTLDFETYYDDDYSLTNPAMSTSEYVRDARFEAISCSIKKDNNTPYCYFGQEEIAAALAKIDWSQAILLAHHSQFDGLIMSHHFGIKPKRWYDTLSMGRALHPKMQSNRLEDVAVHYGKQNKLEMPDFKGKHLADLTKDEKHQIIEYNNADVQSCFEVAQEMLPKIPVGELDLIDITIRMFTEPVLKVDMDLAAQELKDEQTRKATAITAAGVDAKVLTSDKQFVVALRAAGVDVPEKMSKPGKKHPIPRPIPAIAKSDEAFQALALHPDPKVVALVEGRLAAKSTIGESRANRMLLRGQNGMCLPIYLVYCGAHTTRWSGGDKFNPQNFKQLHKQGGRLREAILAPPGYVIVVIDSAQIEARLVAWLFDEEWVLDAFRNKRDLYCEFASKAYERSITKADKEERFVGKTCVLGLGYGMGGPKLQVQLLAKSIEQGLAPVRLPLEVCFKLVTTYRTECAKINDGWKFMNDKAIAAMLSGNKLEHKAVTFEKNRCVLPNGLALLYPGLSANVVRKSGNRFFKGQVSEAVHDATYLGASARNKIYGGLLTENVVQALARVVVADAMREIARSYRVVMMTHDEVAFIAPQSEADAAYKAGTELMCTPPIWAPDLPLAAEGGYDVRYSK